MKFAWKIQKQRKTTVKMTRKNLKITTIIILEGTTAQNGKKTLTTECALQCPPGPIGAARMSVNVGTGMN